MPHHHSHRLLADLQRLAHHHPGDRRHFLRLLAGASLVPLVGCSSAKDTQKSTAASSSSATSDASDANSTTSDITCGTIPEETAGPYPGDGSNAAQSGTVNALQLSGIVRSDIRPSFAGVTGTASGVLVTINLSIVSQASGCASPAAGAVYLWHCDQSGLYSLYTAPEQNYLRGLQATDASGNVSFTSIFPACYSGRWPHIHFEVYPSVAAATSYASKTHTSQMALPADVCNAVYATSGYSASVQNFASESLSTDMVFSDGVSLQTPTVSGDTSNGLTVNLQVAI